MLTNIELKDFRGFADLKLLELGRVNLVVGRNNTGKTSLLEAITIIANPKMISGLAGVFRANPGAVGARFYRWLVRDGARNQEAWLKDVDRLMSVVLRRGSGQAPLSMGHIFSDRDFQVFAGPKNEPLHVRAISVQHRSPEDMIDAFAEAVRPAEGEMQMESLLRAVDSRVQTVRLDYSQGRPFIVVDVGLSERVPLSQAGQGIYRLVAIFSDLLGHKPKICFIDEIENGIHYTALPQVWKGIGEVAERLDLQVFATTHSRDCLIAAHEAFSTRPTYDLRVVQLYRIENRVEGRVLDRKLIETGIEEDIDLR